MNRLSPPAPLRAAARAATALLFTLALLLPSLAAPAAGQRAGSQPKRRAGVSRKTKAAPARKSAAKRGGEARPSGQASPLQAPVTQEQEIEADDADKRENWFYAERAYPSGEIPADARRRAWESRPGREKGGGRISPLAQFAWNSVGPAPSDGVVSSWGPTSGRINAIAVHPTSPNVVLVGASTGGIWRSADGGATFAPVSDDQVDLAVGAIAFAPSTPNVVYAGMGDLDNSYVGTGVLKSTDAGQTWARVGDPSFPAQGFVTDIAVDPNNPNRVFVTQDLSLIPTGAPTTGYAFLAGGVIISNDGGATWQRTLRARARNLAIHPTNPQIIYAATRVMDPPTTGGTPGVFKSTDGGQSWTLVYASPYYDPARPTTLFTRDIQVAVTPAAPENVYVYAGRTARMTQDTSEPIREIRVEVSTNGGGTWSSRGAAGTLNIDTGQFGYNTYIEVSPSDPGTIYVGGRDIYKTTTGTLPAPVWTNITRNFHNPPDYSLYNPTLANTHPDQQAFAFDPTNPNVVYAGNDGGISKSTNAGLNFDSLNQTLALTQFVHLSLHPTDGSISYGGTQDNGTQRRVEGTRRWKEFSSGDGGRSVINPADNQMVFTTYVSGRVNRHVNNGLNFSGTLAETTTFEPGPTPRIAFYPPLVGNGVDHRLYLGTWRLFVCDDCHDTSKRIGASLAPTWTSPAPSTDLTKGNGDVLETIAVARANPNVIYTGSRQGRAMVSTNGGIAWVDITLGLPNRVIKSITIDPASTSTAYLTVSGYGSGHVFRTTNAGASWTDISGNLPNVPVNAFLIDPQSPSTLYVGTDVGVFRTTNGGAAWESFNTGMPPVVVTAFAAQAGGRIQVATYGRGVYELSVAPDPVVQFSAAGASVGEGAARATLTVTRTGSAVGAATVDYQTADADTFTVGCADAAGAQGAAFARCDFATAVGTLSFAPGETTKTVTVPVIDDAHLEGNETFQLRLSNATGTSLGALSVSTVTIQDNDHEGAQNPIVASHGFFVRQQYLDFLSREPDAAGFAAWLGVLNTCPNVNAPPGEPSGCDRLHVSGEGFFRSTEFRLKASYAFRFYRVAFSRLPEYAEIVSDMSFVAGATEAEVFARRAQLAERFAVRPEFTQLYGQVSGGQYVDALLGRYNLTQITTPDPSQPDASAKVALSGAELTGRLNTGTLSRAQVLRAVVDSDEVGAAEFDNTFVAMQYYGYLRRKPEPTGYEAWLRVLRAGDVRTMVDGFLNSTEYKLRFGRP